MPDESSDLRATLSRLHEQLRSAQDVSGETRALLQGVIADIHALLKDEESATGQATDAAAGPDARKKSIAERLTAAEREFEATHPTLAGIVGSVIAAVGRMGV